MFRAPHGGAPADHIGVNWLALNCESCGHGVRRDPAARAEHFGAGLSLADLAARATCSRCGQRGAAIRILPGSREYGGPPQE